MPSQTKRPSSGKGTRSSHKRPTRRNVRNQRPGRSRNGKRIKKVYAYRKMFAVAVLVIVLICVMAAGVRSCMVSSEEQESTDQVSEAVLAYKPAVERYAKEYGVEKYVDLLLAIMQVESRGEGNDVMQSSESLGLPVNSLMPEASIEQGCHVFSQLISYGDTLGCDLNSVIQSYNFGITYLDYVAENGKVHTFELAQTFAKEMSGGKIVDYVNTLSVERNGGWRYNYGNMFYVELVRQYYPE